MNSMLLKVRATIKISLFRTNHVREDEQNRGHESKWCLLFILYPNGEATTLILFRIVLIASIRGIGIVSAPHKLIGGCLGDIMILLKGARGRHIFDHMEIRK